MWLPLLALATLAAGAPAARESTPALERQAFETINRERAAKRLPALAWDEDLAKQARAHSTRMRDLGFFAHEDPEYGGIARRLTRAGVAWTSCAENIFRVQGYPDPARSAVRSWMSSPGHRRNVLDPRYTRSGLGVAAARDGTYYFTQIFAR